MKIRVSTPVTETVRVAQVRGIFDLQEEATSTVEWDVELPLHEQSWHVGLIVGPSGSGKSTIARSLWGGYVHTMDPTSWPDNESVLDGFPESLPVKEVIEALSSVGFSSPPAWLRPYKVLSTGQQFRVTLARSLVQHPPGSPLVFDEFTSVVDRTVAQVGSAAVAKLIRKHGKQFVAVTCHEDVEEWLQPDWVYRPAERHFAWRSVRRRPSITLDIFRVKASAWELFAPHHYLDTELMPAAVSFAATWQDRPVAFSSWTTHFGNGPRTKREHRTVTLPDYQGVGIGNALSDFCSALWKALGWRAQSTTTHPAMINARLKSDNWYMHRAPSMRGKRDKCPHIHHAMTRLTAGFTYIGPALNKHLAQSLHDA